MCGELSIVSSPRTQARLFRCVIYAITIVFLLGSVWLFACNFGHVDRAAVKELLGRGWFWRSVWLSMFTATVTTLIAVAVGIPAAYAMSRFDFRGKTAIDVLFASVIVLPASTVGLCLMVAFQYGPMLRLQDALGFRVVHSVGGICIAQLVLALALGLKAWRSAFDSLNPRFEHVARSLGSSRWRTFWTVTLPAAKVGLCAGIILAWTRAMAEFGAVLIFSGTFRMRHPSQFSSASKFLGLTRADLLSVGMWMEIEGGRVGQGVVLAFALVLITAASVYSLNRLSGKGYLW